MKKKLTKEEIKKRQSEAGKKAYQTKMANLAKKEGEEKKEIASGLTDLYTKKISDIDDSDITSILLHLSAIIHGRPKYIEIQKGIMNYFKGK
jgi:hypothetical protein